MKVAVLILLCMQALGCAHFDPTNIQPGQRVPGPGYSFTVPTQKAWSAVEFATSNRIHLFQLNNHDSYTITVALNRGPYLGMFQRAEDHLATLQLSKHAEFKKSHLKLLEHEEWLAPEYGELCVAYRYKAEDWQGRLQDPVIKELHGLVCEFPVIQNVLISAEISRRAESTAQSVDLLPLAKELFASIEYRELD